ncbi:hypothetical protein F8M41_018197 [Gigaspora margarita]|uniref:Uncharacterized protein n=1 Tax=Gigaspora margarita TaxID=4874 RepID=A0A8H4AM38_GIGMA|nr:hypothetical protein F8M41_018197 [Gigaspora margarita]
MHRFYTYLLNLATEESRFTCITIPKQERHLKKKKKDPPVCSKGIYDSHKKELDPKRQKEAILEAGKGDSNIARPRAISCTFDQSPEESTSSPEKDLYKPSAKLQTQDSTKQNQTQRNKASSAEKYTDTDPTSKAKTYQAPGLQNEDTERYDN